MKISPIIIVVLAVLLSVGSAGFMVVSNYDALFKPKPEIKAEFTSVEFDADDTSYSPAETHSMNQLSKELAALKQKLLDREKELDSRESAITMDLEALEKQKKEMINNLNKGDKVVTMGGIIGTVTGFKEKGKLITLKVDNNTTLTFNKSAIAGLSGKINQDDIA